MTPDSATRPCTNLIFIHFNPLQARTGREAHGGCAGANKATEDVPQHKHTPGHADVAQRQSTSFPSWGRGFDTRHRLHTDNRTGGGI